MLYCQRKVAVALRAVEEGGAGKLSVCVILVCPMRRRVKMISCLRKEVQGSGVFFRRASLFDSRPSDCQCADG